MKGKHERKPKCDVLTIEPRVHAGRGGGGGSRDCVCISSSPPREEPHTHLNGWTTQPPALHSLVALCSKTACSRGHVTCGLRCTFFSHSANCFWTTEVVGSQPLPGQEGGMVPRDGGSEPWTCPWELGDLRQFAPTRQPWFLSVRKMDTKTISSPDVRGIS